MSNLRARHSSVVKRTIKPKGMAAFHLASELRQSLEQTALDIYTDMTNAGHSLQATVLAIYLSGMEHAIRAQEENKQ